MNNVIILNSMGDPVNNYYQWDADQTIVLGGLQIDSSTTVHFCNMCSPNALVVAPDISGGKLYAKVPNILLQSASPIIVYVYCSDDDTGSRTIYATQIAVIPRQKPEDYVYTETEVLHYQKLDERIRALEVGGGSGSPSGGVVLYTIQSLTEDQKLQARSNIGVNDELARVLITLGFVKPQGGNGGQLSDPDGTLRVVRNDEIFLPEVTDEDNNKVLIFKDGRWQTTEMMSGPSQGTVFGVGKNVAGVEFEVDDKTITASDNAEIFNDYENNVATGEFSHAEGSYTFATGDEAHAEGDSTVASGFASHAEGSSGIASGDSAHVEGWAQEASGTASHAEGRGTLASGEACHAEGYDSKATNWVDHAEGNYTLAEGGASHAEGEYTKASGYASHAEGYETESRGYNSHAEGAGTVAVGDESHAQGRYNIIDEDGKYAHIVGNGSEATSYGGEPTRSNAHTVDWDGNAWFAGNIKIGGSGYDDPNAQVLSGGVSGGIGGYVAQDTEPEDTSVLWVDTNDDSDDGFREALDKLEADLKIYVDEAISGIANNFRMPSAGAAANSAMLTPMDVIEEVE